MKTNELGGIGNHNTAMFWEYDTRLGRRGSGSKCVDRGMAIEGTAEYQRGIHQENSR